MPAGRQAIIKARQRKQCSIVVVVARKTVTQLGAQENSLANVSFAKPRYVYVSLVAGQVAVMDGQTDGQTGEQTDRHVQR